MLKVHGASHIETVRSQIGLAKLKERLGRYAEAEQELVKVVAQLDKLVGPEHPEFADALRHTALVKLQTGQFAEAEPLFRRSIEVSERARGSTHRGTLFGKRLLGVTLLRQDRILEAEQLLRKVLDDLQGGEAELQLIKAHTHEALADLLITAQRHAEAEVELAAAFRIYGTNHSASAYISRTYNLMGRAQAARHQYDDAIQAFDRSIDIATITLGPAHPAVVNGLVNRGAARLADEKIAGALEDYRKANSIISRRMQSYHSSIEGRSDPARSIQSRRHVLSGHLRATWAAAQRQLDSIDVLANEALQSVQHVENSTASTSLAQLIVRLAAKDDPQAQLIRRSQDLAERWRSLNGELTESLGGERVQGAASRPLIRQELAKTDTEFFEVMGQLRRDFPEYASLIAPSALEISEIRDLLSPTEALVAFHLDATQGFVWLVTKEGSHWRRLDINAQAAANAIARLRASLDPNQLNKPGAGLFSLAEAYDLYSKLLGPLSAELSGKSHLLLVQPGPLSSLPMQLLVTEPPAEAIPSDPQQYADAAWLIKRHALSTLPSIASLKLIRTFAERNPAAKPFVGFGDPVFDPAVPQPTPVPGVTRAVAGRGVLPFSKAFKGTRVNVALLRSSLAPLADTADEIRAVGRTLDASPSDMMLGSEASEERLKRLALRDYRVVYFATHALVSGELSDIAGPHEPALVLSIPELPVGDDDGLLTASEIAQLKLNADWVVLSGCNTAAGDRPGADALSGLARAFMYAGARTLLVTHWPVFSDAAVKITTRSFEELKRDPSIGRAEALRQSMLALIKDRSHPLGAYPAVWAPFALIGDGAR